MTELELWEKYVKATGLGDEAKYSGNFGFEAKGFAGAERLASPHSRPLSRTRVSPASP